jgi:hypothetical protein
MRKNFKHFLSLMTIAYAIDIFAHPHQVLNMEGFYKIKRTVLHCFDSELC